MCAQGQPQHTVRESNEKDKNRSDILIPAQKIQESLVFCIKQQTLPAGNKKCTHLRQLISSDKPFIFFFCEMKTFCKTLSCQDPIFDRIEIA